MKLEVREGSFQYGSGKALFKNISFSIKEGEILTILGPNGVGKTTLLKCVTGMMPWKYGKTILDGTPLDTMKKTSIWQKISYIPQSHNVVFPYKVLEMVLMGRAPYINVFSMPSKKDIRMAEQTLETVGIAHLAGKPCSKISGGELQLVLIARALASEPLVLILDEPESHLDFRNQLTMFKLLQTLAEKKQLSCIINTHYPDHALRISHKTLMLAHGNQHLFGKTREVINEANIESFFKVNTKIVTIKQNGKDIKSIVALSHE
ncbi:iron complex transport system ATP-binding protein [Desulfocicer vacuolatum DSM 3385]|uniref:Iron complex transport system ATP-binding protein n=1 Tax=Desulfocicer vacuolatum DSM 3385 TaxID=1121400 RepID=A0A1W2AR36_9BACT|nr:ABC transporter ATP-binding protein [Desulfocicer vacuolatum]SMC62891.1 iron complex transport system ATP-binding protein [Desulfocicer vacuolatum DSM 3385]